MSATPITKYFDRDEELVDTSTVFTASEVTSGPVFSLGVRQSQNTTLQIDWQNNTGDINILVFARTTPAMNWMPMKFLDCEGQPVTKISITGAIGSHMLHITKKFNDIDIRFEVNSGQAYVKVSGIVE